MVISPLLCRRNFIKAAGLGFLSSLAPNALFALERTDAVYCSAFMGKDGTFGVATLTESGNVIDRIPMIDRGHDVTRCSTSDLCVVFARRPGTFAVVFDCRKGALVSTLTSPEGRHFFGHGIFSEDGRFLYATENDYDNYAGVIGVYDAADHFRRIDEFPTHGIDPHELTLIENGKTLIIANGGIKTHPDHGRDKLNLDHMEPSLVFIDLAHGQLIERHVLPENRRQLSTRHLDVDASGTVWIGCQFEGPADEIPPLVGRIKRGETLAFLDLPDDDWRMLGNYVGSVAANPSAGLVAVSSPKGGAVLSFDAASGKTVKRERTEAVCGLAPFSDGFIRSTENGLFGHNKADMAWDNHILKL
jgi:hypothetical protein